MDTKIIDFYENKDGYSKCIDAIKNNGVVVFPTETVYGIGSNALNTDAILKIYEVKSRAKDNPLIVHIGDKDVSKYGKNISHNVYRLIDEFWPGPLTIILEKRNVIPYETTGGRETVALRMPNHEIALDLINKTGLPIAAPSANISGRPSGTNARRCFEDLYGKVKYIIDGKESDIGLESTVISMVNDEAIVLRPGHITIDQIKKVIPKASLYDKINEKFVGSNPISPGLKYKHYAPKGDMIILKGDINKILNYIEKESLSKKKTAIICTRENYKFYDELNTKLNGVLEIIKVGSAGSYLEIGRNLFESIRKCDDLECDFIISECFFDDFSSAVMNRLLKASSHNLIIL